MSETDFSAKKNRLPKQPLTLE